MRKRTMRAALPAVAVAAALVLTGCNGDEEPSSENTPSEDAERGGNAGDGETGGDAQGDAQGTGSAGPKPENLSEIDAATLPGDVTPDDLVNLIPDGLADLIPWEELEDLGIPGPDDDLPAATVDELQGSWYTGPDLEDAMLSFSGNDALYVEDWVAEGDICDGTASDGALELNDCTMYGEVPWPSMSATLEFDGPTLVVTWDDGTVQEYQSENSTATT